MASGSSNISPIKLNIGRSDVRRVSGLPGELGRDLQKVFKEMGADFKWYCDQVESFLPQDLEAALQPTFDLSQEYCPVKSGDMKASGYIRTAQSRSGDNVNTYVEMGYGLNNEPPYTIYVHEIPATHEAPTQDKWLQRAVDETYYTILNDIVQNVRTRMGLG